MFKPNRENNEKDCCYRKDFYRMHQQLRFLRPFVLIFNLVILYFLFKWLGFNAVTVLFVIFISVKEVVHITFLWRLERQIFRPMSELKNAVDEIAKGNYDVKVTVEMENEFGVLIRSFNEMAESLKKSDELKTVYEENRKDLIANISHDLKTPIASMQGYLEVLLETKGLPPEQSGKYMQIIYNNTVYMNKLIDDLFLFSKLDLAKLDFNFETTKIRSYMQDLMEELSLELDDRVDSFNFTDALTSTIELKIDRKRIQQAIRNIIGNAVKFSAEGGLRLDVSLMQINQKLLLAIKDNGPGIPGDKLGYIFDRFYRVDCERTKDFMSTGLGLSIAKELVEAHGGVLVAASTYGKGSTFTIELPISTEAPR